MWMTCVFDNFCNDCCTSCSSNNSDVYSHVLQVCVKRAFSMHMTVNPAASPPNHDLPSDLKAYFRTVSLVKPDIGLILKAKCGSMSFKAPAVLGARLKVLAELARDQL